jgi:hypothetical protein
MKRLVLSAALLFCAGITRAEDAGTSALEFLKLPVAARQASMAGGGVALADDVMAARDNPAALALLPAWEAGFTYNSYLEGIRYEHAALGIPLPYGAIGVDVTSLSYGQIDGYSADDQPTGDVSAGDLAAGLSYAYALKNGLALGVTGRFLREKIDYAVATGASFDAGLQYLPNASSGLLSHVSFGAAAQNLGPGIRFESEKAPLPRQWSLGVGLDGFQKRLQSHVEIRKPLDRTAFAAVGAEYWLLRALALRVGYETRDALGPGVGAGIGLRIKAVQLDYAWRPSGDLGNSHVISLIVRWGERALAKRNFVRLPRRVLRRTMDASDPRENEWTEDAEELARPTDKR